MTPAAVYSPLILLAEDDVLVRNLVRSFLQRKTYRVLVAANGKEALHLSGTHQGHIDLFLSDVEMPFMNGVRAYREIQIQRPGIKVLFMSGGETMQSNLPEPWPFLPKPFDMDGLLYRLDQILCERGIGGGPETTNGVDDEVRRRPADKLA